MGRFKIIGVKKRKATLTGFVSNNKTTMSIILFYFLKLMISTIHLYKINCMSINKTATSCDIYNYRKNMLHWSSQTSVCIYRAIPVEGHVFITYLVVLLL